MSLVDLSSTDLPHSVPVAVEPPSAAVTFLFTDVEGSTRQWESEPERMRHAMAQHDVLVRAAVLRHQGVVVKMTGDGVHAAFMQPLQALSAALAIQLELTQISNADAAPLAVRCGLHMGIDEQRDNDYFGPSVNRAARIMSAAHGGQILLSQAVRDGVADTLPQGVALLGLGLVRLRDLTAPEALYQLVHPQLRTQFPPLRSLASTPNNLPQQLNSFIGRERELVQTRERLQAARLLTLLGMGGLGKSRLSLQLAAEMLEEFPDGVWFVELAGLTGAMAVPQALASVLHVQDAGRPVIEALLNYVRDKCMLIVLDNCEHVIGACAELTKALLQAGAHIKVLASSRDVLRIAGEVVYHVPPLATPSPHKKLSLELLAAHEAIRLFVERVSAVRSDFVLTPHNSAAVVDICHRLDGIPLALELAAARARALSVENIAARLSNRFRLLTSSDQTVLPRQRTLRALIDWSYDLLAPEERAVLRRLAVFAGGWTLAAAEAVCVGESIQEMDVLDLQSQLVEKSLIVMQPDGQRYRMLDTVRAYAQEQLQQHAEEERITCRRHLDFFLALAEQACPELGKAQQSTWLAQLDEEHENMLTAHSWAENVDDAQLGVRLVFSLRPYWINRGQLSMGQRASIDLLTRPGLQARNLMRCRALAGAGQMCFFMGQDSEARAYLAESLTIARENDDKPWIARVLQPLGMACLGEGDMDCARAYLEEAVELAHGLSNKHELLAALNALAMLHRLKREFQPSETLYREALLLARAQGDEESVAIVLLNLSMALMHQDKTMSTDENVPRMLLEALEIAVISGSNPVGRSALEVGAGWAAVQQRWQEAAWLFGAVQAQMHKTGLRRDPADEAFLAPLMANARQMLGELEFSVALAQGEAVELDAAFRRLRQGLEDTQQSKNHVAQMSQGPVDHEPLRKSF